MPLSFRGAEGEVRWGYHHAAALGPWTVERTDTTVVLTATVVTSDAYRLSQRPITFVVRHALGVWRWPIESLQVTGASLTAVLGPKERSG